MAPFVHLLIGVAVTTAALAYAFWNVSLPLVWGYLSGGQYLWLIPFWGSLFLFYWLTALRWGVLLGPIGKFRSGDMVPSMMIGFAANNVLPGRVGEVVRAVFFARGQGLSKVSVLTTLVAERLLDVVAVVGLYAVGALLLRPLPTELGVGTTVIFAALLAVVAGLWIFLRYPTVFDGILGVLNRILPIRVAEAGQKALNSTRTGLGALTSRSMLGRALLYSAAKWICAGLMAWFSLRICGVSVSFAVAVVVIAFTVLFITIPNAPGNLGTIQAAFVYSLIPFGVDQEPALAASIIFLLAQWVPVTLVGGWFLSRRAAGPITQATMPALRRMAARLWDWLRGNQRGVHILFVGLLCMVSVVNFFHGGWAENLFFHRFDPDAWYVPQALLLANNGALFYNHHPGATIYTLVTPTLRLLSGLGFSSYPYSQLSVLQGTESLEALLTSATIVARGVSLAVMMGITGLFYVLLFRFTRKTSLALLGAVLLVGSWGMQQHTGWVRPEGPSLLFAMGAAVVWVFWGRRWPPGTAGNLGTNVLAGLFFVLAVFSKVQILPILAFFLLAYLAWLLIQDQKPPPTPRSAAGWVLGLSAANLVLFPWWAVQRPGFLDRTLVWSLSGDFGRTYGALPPDFLLLAGNGLVALLCLAGVAVALRGSIREAVATRLMALAGTLTGMAGGTIVGFYVVMAPTASTLRAYLNNTQHLVYSTLTNITGLGFLEDSEAGLLGKLRVLYNGSWRWSIIPGVNQPPVTGLVILVCGFLLYRARKWEPRPMIGVFVFGLVLIAFGHAMELLSSLRWKGSYDYYAIYSLPFYCAGLALLFRSATQGRPRLQTALGVFGGVWVASALVYYGVFRHLLGASADANRVRSLLVAGIPEFSRKVGWLPPSLHIRERFGPITWITPQWASLLALLLLFLLGFSAMSFRNWPTRRALRWFALLLLVAATLISFNYFAGKNPSDGGKNDKALTEIQLELEEQAAMSGKLPPPIGGRSLLTEQGEPYAWSGRPPPRMQKPPLEVEYMVDASHRLFVLTTRNQEGVVDGYKSNMPAFRHGELGADAFEARVWSSSPETGWFASPLAGIPKMTEGVQVSTQAIGLVDETHRVILAHVPDAELRKFTLAVWFRVSDHSPCHSETVLVGLRAGDKMTGLTFFRGPSVWGYVNHGDNGVTTSGNSNFDPTNWTFVALSFEDSWMSLYLGGDRVDRARSKFSAATGGGELFIEQGKNCPPTQIAAVRFSRRPLKQAEVRKMVNREVGRLFSP